MEIKIEQGFDLPPRGNKSNFLTQEIKDKLLKMSIGDSFVVEKITTVSYIQYWGKTIGKRFSSRKVYKGDKNLSLRVWLEGDRVPALLEPRKRDYQKNQPKPFGSLSKKASESDGEGSATERSKVPSEILTLIELKEENRMIVDDLNQIKRILKEELGYTDWSLKTDLMEDSE